VIVVLEGRAAGHDRGHERLDQADDEASGHGGAVDGEDQRESEGQDRDTLAAPNANGARERLATIHRSRAVASIIGVRHSVKRLPERLMGQDSNLRRRA
jgi:hypothetical protein